MGNLPNKTKIKNVSAQQSEMEVNVATSLDRNTIIVEINGNKIQSLVDSGASISCLQKSTFDKVNHNNSIKIQPSNIARIVGVGGERHQVLGQVKLTLKISGINVDQNFIVLEQLHHPLILGLDFMQQQNVKIDFQQRLMSFHDNLVAVALTCDSKFGYARSVKREVIPAESEFTIPVKLSKSAKQNVVLLEPAESLQNLNLAGARCLVNAKNKRAVLRLMNPTKNDIVLSPFRVIANINVIEPDQVYSFEDNSANISSAMPCSKTSEKVPNSANLSFNINNPNLSKEQKEKLVSFLKQNNDVFSQSLDDIGMTDLTLHKIETLPGAKPVHQRFYRQDPIKKAETERQTNEMLKANLIERSSSVWNSPVVLVKKKDGSWRFAVDYRKLNEITIPISHPLPRIEDVFDALGESHATIFSTLDLNSAYFQVPLDPETRHKSAFVTHEGVFEFTRMPFGLRNAPMSFQMLMSLVLKGANWKYVLCYIDDILVFSPNLETHLQHLHEVFHRLREANLTLKPSKCEFGVNKVHFLGHVISENGVAVDPRNTDKVQKFPVPVTQKQLRGFLGLCNYYRRFVKNYSTICVPLNALLKKEVKRNFSPSDWTPQCQAAFETLKQALISPPILRFVDMDKEFILSTDASKEALGFVLGQKDENGKEYVIAYGGRAVRPDERKWHSNDLECLALITGIETYRHYLSHRHFTINTDNSAMKWLMEKKEPTGRYARWIMKIQSYNFTIVHRKGSQNQNADAISRIDYSRLSSSSVPNTGQSSTDSETGHSAPLHPQVATCTSNTPSTNHVQSSNVETLTSEHSQTACLNDQEELIQVTFEYENLRSVSTIKQEANEPDVSNIATLQRQCDDFKHIINYLESNIVPEDKKLANLVTVVAENQYVLDDNVLYHTYTPRTKNVKEQNLDILILQLALPACKRNDVLAAYHDCKAGGGHFGIKRTFASIKQKYWWPKMYQQVKDYISTCDVCQRAKVSRTRHSVPLNPLPIEDVFSRIHIDILCSLPKTKEGFQYVLLIVDSFSKWTEAFPLRTQEAKEVADILYNEIFTRYGAPRCIVSDRGRNFMSKLVKALCEYFEVKRSHTSSYHPETNATVERANSTLAQTIRTYVDKDQMNWPSLLPSIMMAFRSSPCTESTGFSPFQLLFGKEMNLPIDTSLIPKPTLHVNVRQYFEQLIGRLKFVKEIARKNMQAAQDKAKHNHDLKAKEPDYKVGDKVLLKNEKVSQGLSVKIADKFEGPYEIIELGPNYTYKLRSCENNKVLGSLINATRLKLFHERQTENIDNPQDDQQANMPNPENTNIQPPLIDDQRPRDMPQPMVNEPQTVDTGEQPANRDETKRTQPPEPVKDMSDIRIINANRKGGKQRYRIEWPDGSRAWEPERNVPKQAIDNYLKHYTKVGRKRKHKSKFFTKSSE